MFGLGTLKTNGVLTMTLHFKKMTNNTFAKVREFSVTAPLTLKRTILILSASPINKTRLILDQEVKEIDNVLRSARGSGNFAVVSKWAVRIDDLQDALLDIEPEVVHICCYGAGDNGLVMENERGKTQRVPTHALANLFKLVSNHVRCVVLNACYSEVQAEAIHQHIKYVIGLKQSIGDKAAIQFAKGFYRGGGNDRSFDEAYKWGCNAIELENSPSDLTPVLKVKPINH